MNRIIAMDPEIVLGFIYVILRIVILLAIIYYALYEIRKSRKE